MKSNNQERHGRLDVCPFCGSPAIFDTSLGVNKCSVCIARETIHGWQKSTWGVCGICGHDAVVSDPGLDMDLCLDCGAHETAVGWLAGGHCHAAEGRLGED
jgi:hypothetical protein